jgi:hypothetical protein
VAIVIWLVAWYGLARFWGRETVNMQAINLAALVLLAIGFLLTFRLRYVPFQNRTLVER